MLKALTTIILIALIQTSLAQKSPEQVVQQQLDAYNSRSIDAFMKIVCDSAEFWVLGEEKPWAVGHEAIKSVYQKLFESSPNLHSELLSRTILGNTIIDHEKITGRLNADSPIELIMVYVVEEEKIIRAYAIRE
jgi:hypothetical protein